LRLQKGDRPIKITEVARVQGLSAHYLTKIFRDLTQAGLMESYRGSGGGYRMRPECERISLKDIILAVEGQANPYQDEWKLRGCRLAQSCLIKDVFTRAYNRMLEELDKVTIDDVAQQFLVKGFPPWVVAPKRNHKDLK